jgi:hypothetical protein
MQHLYVKLFIYLRCDVPFLEWGKDYAEWPVGLWSYFVRRKINWA